MTEIAERLRQVDQVVADPLRFKARLEIGEKAYASLTLKKRAFEVWDVAGAAFTGAQVAKSAVVATTFFSTSGFWSFLGATTVATTQPSGVVAAAPKRPKKSGVERTKPPGGALSLISGK